MSKDCIQEFAWALGCIYNVEPSLPVHQSSLFEILTRVFGLPEGKTWLLVYDLKALLQTFARLVTGCYGSLRGVITTLFIGVSFRYGSLRPNWLPVAMRFHSRLQLIQVGVAGS